MINFLRLFTEPQFLKNKNMEIFIGDGKGLIALAFIVVILLLSTNNNGGSNNGGLTLKN